MAEVTTAVVTDSDAPAGRRRRRSVLRTAAVVVCCLALVGPAVLLLTRLAGWDDGTVLAMPMSTLPYATLATLVVLAALLALRSWRTAAAAGLLAAVLLALVGPRFVPDGASVPAAAPRLRVATSNAYLGQVDAAALVRLVREQRVDVLAVEELSPGAARRLDEAGIGELMPYREQPNNNDTALYSRLPLTRLDASDPAAARGQVGAQVTVAGHRVRLVAVHTYYPLGNARKWADGFEGLEAAARADTRDSVLMGDFNATLDHAPMRALLDTGLTDTHAELGRGGSPTWPEHNADFPYLPPIIQIDHVLHGGALTGVDVSEHTVHGSDHRAVVAELAVTG
ncbi:endonuclease/exonuclease/phosphatase family protein [Kitasatospora sp. NPDC088346]|uniref:endonuclease/exonuclease/phosphatase family protein n=1 Tax=Kitasatospora sp. NPDC088346 TaxID=3364073 RepID=UPI00380521C6